MGKVRRKMIHLEVDTDATIKELKAFYKKGEELDIGDIGTEKTATIIQIQIDDVETQNRKIGK